jgi:hypothetical protein
VSRRSRSALLASSGTDSVNVVMPTMVPRLAWAVLDGHAASADSAGSVRITQDAQGVADPAALSVVFTGTVGILGAATAATGHFVTLRNEDRKRQEGRREDLRVALDDAARLAMEIDQAFEEDQTVVDVLKYLATLRSRLPIQQGPIGVRLGPDSDEYKAYARFVEAVAAVDSAFEQLPRDALITPDGITAATRQLGFQKGSEVVTALNTSTSDAKAALNEFMAAAHARVGADV